MISQLAAVALGISVGSCSMQKLDGVSYYIAPPLGSGHCVGSIEAIQTLGLNGNGRLQVLGPEGIREIRSDATVYRLAWSRKSFVAQSSPDTCWAAVLAMAFRHLGFDYSEANFIEPVRRICNGLTPEKATLNQIVYGLTSGYTRQPGVWISDREGEIAAWEKERRDRKLTKLAADALGVAIPKPLPPIPDGTNSWVFRASGAPPPPSMVAPIEWTTTYSDGRTSEGGVFPIHSTDELWAAVSRNEPVVLGLSRGGRRHVVLVVGTTARVGGMQLEKTGMVIPAERSQTKIEAIEIVDPAGDGTISVLSGDDLIRQVRFSFLVRP